jgi:xanthine dehydrogenase YagR molybdenum-binding subunit
MSTAAPEPKENMGKPEPRIDGRLKVTGEARYGSDFPVANPAYAFLVTSAIAKGRITAMNLTEGQGRAWCARNLLPREHRRAEERQ